MRTGPASRRCASRHPLSLLAEGSGYWRYVPGPDGTVRFLTGYDYRPRWGRAGALVDRLVFRPLMGWAAGPAPDPDRSGARTDGTGVRPYRPGARTGVRAAAYRRPADTRTALRAPTFRRTARSAASSSTRPGTSPFVGMTPRFRALEEP